MNISELPEEKREVILPEIVAIYKNAFGTITAEMYSKAYAKQDLPTILTSFQELMIEFAGNKKGQEMVNMFFAKFNITK